MTGRRGHGVSMPHLQGLYLFSVRGSATSPRCIIEQIRYHSRPARLVAGTDPCTCISMKVLVERNSITPVRVALKHRVGAKHGPAALLVPQKDTGEAACELLCDLPQGQLCASAGGILHQVLVAVELVVFPQCIHQQEIDRKPDRSAPVGIPAECPAGGL